MAQICELNSVKSSRSPAAESNLFTIISSESPFRNQWYAVAPLADLPQDRPYGIELFNTPLVVFFDRIQKTWNCILDQCKHRCATLSCGTVSADGTLTCFYHGWQYDGKGYCVNIPSIGACRKNDKLKVDHFAIHVQAKILWVFAGLPENADVSKMPPTPWGDPKLQSCLFVRDTEFDWLIYNEHNMDRDHLTTAHAKTLKMLPKPAGPPTRIWGPDPDARRGFHYLQALSSSSGEQYYSTASFYPPATTIATEDRRGCQQGICFTVTPLAYGRCRLIFLIFRAKRLPVPEFLFHITFARVTEEDAILVRSQMKRLADRDLAADEAFVSVPVDNAPRDYRAWLRATGGICWQHEVNQHVKDHSPVQARTLARASTSIYKRWEGNMHLACRYSQHFRICRTCQEAHKNLSDARLCLFLLAALTLMFLVHAGAKTAWPVFCLAGLMTFSGGTFLSHYLIQLLEGQRF